jgi:hypothetical protein
VLDLLRTTFNPVNKPAACHAATIYLSVQALLLEKPGPMPGHAAACLCNTVGLPAWRVILIAINEPAARHPVAVVSENPFTFGA